MTATIANHGPDDEGTWIGGPAALGHHRLAIIDIRAAASRGCSRRMADLTWCSSTRVRLTTTASCVNSWPA